MNRHFIKRKAPIQQADVQPTSKVIVLERCELTGLPMGYYTDKGFRLFSWDDGKRLIV